MSSTIQPTQPTAPVSHRGAGAFVDDLALDLRGIAKTYRGKVKALRGIDLGVARGAVFGLLGPNGAGKSTLVKILLTVIRPSRAEGHLLGSRIGDREALRRVGYLPEHHRFPEYLTARQVIDHAACMTGVDPNDRRRRAPALLDLVGLSGWHDKRVGTFSKGMRQRLGIAQALVNEPDLVILDEPTDGVDPVGRRDIRDIINRLRDDGKTVFLNSHLLSELEMVCDRVAILVQGVVASQGTIDELTADKRAYQLEIVPPTAGSEGGSNESSLVAERVARVLPGFAPSPPSRQGLVGESSGPSSGADLVIPGRLAGGIEARVQGSVLTVKTEDPEAVQPLIDAIRSAGLSIRAVRPIRPSLEDLFMQAVTDPTTGQTLQPGARRDKP
ncbi:MAG: ATP-binding cassette domain-containing protein [Phycisphaerales bacterium]